ncbi:8789_t:CDS:2, partial [Racocetra fulgida]
MSLASSCQPYGQNETLVSSIRNITKDYPSESVFKEFLQNADDAGATRFHVIIDARRHPTETLLSNEMKAWQGDDTKIGKHGLGFNSCYHFTDVPSFISGDCVAFLDPHQKYLPTKER